MARGDLMARSAGDADGNALEWRLVHSSECLSLRKARSIFFSDFERGTAEKAE